MATCEFCPKVSIIIPVYNTASYLHQCLDSLVAQSLQEIEIICVNDCSTDNSLQILEEYRQKDKRIVIIDLPQNLKQGGARNAGMRKARSPFLGFVDSDDWVATDMYERLYTTAISEEADMVCADYYNCGSKTEVVINGEPELFSRPKSERDKYFLLNGGRIWTNIFKRSLFSAYKLEFPEGLLYEDNAINVALYLLARNISKINAPLYYYRITNQSSCHSFNNYRFFDRLQTAELFLNHMNTLGFYNSYKAEVEFHFIKLYMVNTLMGCVYNFKSPVKNYIEQIKERIRQLVPDYKNNKYYKTRISRMKRVMFALVFASPDIGITIMRILYKTINYLKR